MAYPYIIATSLFLNYARPFAPIRHSNGDLYALLQNAGDNPATIYVYRSQDEGLTWAVQDLGNSPNIIFSRDFAYTFFDNVIWVAHPGFLSPFNTTSNLWEASIGGGPSPETNVAPFNFAVLAPSILPNIEIVIRPNGDKVVIYSKRTSNGGLNYLSVYFSVYSGGAWTVTSSLMESESGTYINYTLVGATINDSNVIKVVASTYQGYAYAEIQTNNSVTNYNRYTTDLATPLNNFFRTGGDYGAVTFVTLGSTKYVAVPIGKKINLTSPSRQAITPGILLISDDLTSVSVHYFDTEHSFLYGLNWISINVANCGGRLYVIWTKLADDDITYNQVIRAANNTGAGWSAASDLLTLAPGELIESFESKIYSGTLRAVLQNYAGEETYTDPHYFQIPLTCGSGDLSVSVSDMIVFMDFVQISLINAGGGGGGSPGISIDTCPDIVASSACAFVKTINDSETSLTDCDETVFSESGTPC